MSKEKKELLGWRTQRKQKSWGTHAFYAKISKTTHSKTGRRTIHMWLLSTSLRLASACFGGSHLMTSTAVRWWLRVVLLCSHNCACCFCVALKLGWALSSPPSLLSFQAASKKPQKNNKMIQNAEKLKEEMKWKHTFGGVVIRRSDVLICYLSSVPILVFVFCSFCAFQARWLA